jgi:hypothetical protein
MKNERIADVDPLAPTFKTLYGTRLLALSANMADPIAPDMYN